MVAQASADGAVRWPPMAAPGQCASTAAGVCRRSRGIEGQRRRVGGGRGQPPPGLADILGVFARLGMASFGGGLSGWMHREVVQQRRWLTEEGFLAGVALGQVLPGAEQRQPRALYRPAAARAGRARRWPSSASSGRPSCSSWDSRCSMAGASASPAWGWCWPAWRRRGWRIGHHRAAHRAAHARRLALAGGGRDLRRGRAAALADDPGGAGGRAGEHRSGLDPGAQQPGAPRCLTASSPWCWSSRRCRWSRSAAARRSSPKCSARRSRCMAG